MLVFVYGTLKTGQRLHQHLAGARFAGHAVTAPKYRLFRIDWFPGLVKQVQGISISGEVWDVAPDMLRSLDQVEGVDSGLFERRPVQLAAPFDRATVESYFYSGDVDGAEDCGDCW